MVADLGLDELIHFAGPLDRVRTAARYRDADIFTLPSWEEAFGNSFAEALASGLPVVGTNVGGIPELVEHGRNGVLVQPRDPETLAAAIRFLGERPELRAEMGAAESGARGGESQLGADDHPLPRDLSGPPPPRARAHGAGPGAVGQLVSGAVGFWLAADALSGDGGAVARRRIGCAPSAGAGCPALLRTGRPHGFYEARLPRGGRSLARRPALHRDPAAVLAGLAPVTKAELREAGCRAVRRRTAAAGMALEHQLRVHRRAVPGVLRRLAPGPRSRCWSSCAPAGAAAWRSAIASPCSMRSRQWTRVPMAVPRAGWRGSASSSPPRSSPRSSSRSRPTPCMACPPRCARRGDSAGRRRAVPDPADFHQWGAAPSRGPRRHQPRLPGPGLRHLRQLGDQGDRLGVPGRRDARERRRGAGGDRGRGRATAPRGRRRADRRHLAGQPRDAAAALSHGRSGQPAPGRCACGLAFPLLGVVTGREVDMLELQGGRRVSCLS